jgi:C4-dicarboxylate-specific signal transduction histidine kinase
MMISDSHRTSQIFDNIRALFRRTSCVKHEAVNVNSLTLEALRTLYSELKGHDITTRLELTSELPTVMAHKGQLQEVIINLIHNAIEAMEAVKDDRRILRVKTERYRGDAIVISVEDSGPGIDPEKIDSMFDAFVTTKSTGTGTCHLPDDY